MERYLITGGCGFIGSNFIEYLFLNLTFETLVNVDKLNYCANVNNIDEKIQNRL